jgi:hypothetical protein
MLQFGIAQFKVVSEEGQREGEGDCEKYLVDFSVAGD